ncbi:MAG: hypothetical protein A3J66_04435 [Candidatus Magasanikbacteria bacterium RIFCSPHIGHO2_02_FULL_47_14]|uniref:Uncharacterized protein n=1 Tax=Candidatus Magasanikbacteria bacterium RIFCSPHIGHO2_02_FULL_47_14 TaxID=1798680 RepID=A0A1F6M4H1_9BACT|nr:MAG: hypothetical protein A3J66_04435 [Candidatus Magasanikbacteria bacterium RIFCSPHIGHO2_02_FULL_47_14]
MAGRKTRSYGYVRQSDPRTETHAAPRTYSQPKTHRPIKKEGGGRVTQIIWTIITSLFRFIWFFIALVLIKIPRFIWRYRPKLGSAAKQQLGKKLIHMTVGLGVAGFLFSVVLFAWANHNLPDPDKLNDRRVAQSTKIYDRTGEHLLYEIFAEQKRTLVELEEVPKPLINGVVATEDTAFYEHRGIRPLSIARSVVFGLFGSSRVGGGASTLTQQLVKNAILTNEQTLTRKAKEIILSVRLEQKYTKEQILKIYFNEIPYGSTNYGVEAASQSYFGKHVSDLTLAESATLAGLPKAPSRYLNDPDALKERRDFVLRRMFEEGFITEEEKNAAQADPLGMKDRYENIDAPHFVFYVKEQLAQQYGEQLVDTGGLKVITSLDWNLQQTAEKAVTEEGTPFLDAADADNAALVAMDPKTSQILAMVGSRDYFNKDIKGNFNVATRGKRQPGSSFKPIIYTAAFEKGYTPDTVLFDVNTNFAASGKPYEPKNYNLKENGPVTMRQALQGSLNIPAVQTLYLVGSKKGVGFAERLGYTTLSGGDFGLSLVLGGGEVTLLEHAGAYGVLANAGVKHSPVSILKVEEPDGSVLQEWKASSGERVLDQKHAATVSNVLTDDAARSFIFGSGSLLTLPGRPVAVKTGTTNNYVDAWTVGYTPSLVAGVWVGNTDNTPMTKGFDSVRVAAPIWNYFMKEALKDKPVESFPAAPPNDAEKPVLRGSQGGSITLKVDKITGKIATTSTPAEYIVERTYVQAHSILHYVDKDNPRGPVPENPGADPQYQIWENAIQDWIRRKKEAEPNWSLSFEDPPTEYDDIHSLELIPSLQVLAPQASSTLRSRQVTTDIRVSAPRGVTKVTYRIDDRYVGVIREHPFNLSYYARDFSNGAHVLTIIVEDDVGNHVEQQVPFIFDAPEESPTVVWIGDSMTLSQSDFPRAFFLEPFRVDQIQEVRIYKEKENSGHKSLLTTISDFSNLFNGQITFTWGETPERGTWTLSTEVRVAGTSQQGDTLRVTVE